MIFGIYLMFSKNAEFISCFPKNAEFIWWLFLLINDFWNLSHVFQKCGIYLMFSKKCGFYIMIIHYCILFLEISSCFPKNADFTLWLFIIVYCFWKLVHVFQKCGFYIMIIHYCILFLEISSCFPKMRNLHYDYSLLYIVFGN
jgi:hypothetical protein